MKQKYKTALIAISIFFILSLSLAVSYAFYEKPEGTNDHALVYVDGSLSFNFMEGDTFRTIDDKKILNFSITNTSTDSFYYSISLQNVKGGVGADFELKSSREGFQNIQKKFPDMDITFANTIKINGGETHNYEFQLNNPTSEVASGKLVIRLEQDMNNFANVLLKNNVINESSNSKPSINIATDDEGFIESTDDVGMAYYFRGNTTNNYVKFANLNWRVVKINGDGTVKLVLNELMNNNTQYYAKDSEFNMSFESSKIYEDLKSWYQTNLNTVDALIANQKYCTDDSFGSDDKTYASITRIYTNQSPIYECMGTSTALKIGLLTADEVSLAGATNKTNNTKFYLYNDAISTSWWTMSPGKNVDGTYSFIEVSKDGIMNSGTNGTLFRGSRPVISLNKKAQVSGTGKIDDPYIVNVS